MIIFNVFYFLLIIGFLIGYIFTGTYYLLVVPFVMFILYGVSFISFYPLCFLMKFKLYSNNNNLYGKILSKYILPLGFIKGKISLYNRFFEEFETIHINNLLSKKEDIQVENDTKIGFHELDKISLKSYSIFKLHSKRIKKIEYIPFIKLPEHYRFDGYDALQSYLREVNQNNSDEYEIREYQKGDPIKDIHYKISYKFNKLMIKERINTFNDISIYLDLSGNEDDIIHVLSYLYCFIESVEIFNRECVIYWNSKENYNQYKLKNKGEFNHLLELILSNPKASIYSPLEDCWVITNNGIDGGDGYGK